MRTITIPEKVLRRAFEGPYIGASLEFAVSVNWPELMLTESQIIANAIARAYDRPEPFPDHSIFSITIPYLGLFKMDGLLK